MKSVIRYVSFSIALVSSLQIHAQSSEKLKKEQQRLEKKITNTKSLLRKTKTHTQATLNSLRLIDHQIKYREELVYNFDNQVRTAEIRMRQKDMEIHQLQERIKKLKAQYQQLLVFAYKHRNKYGKMMFIFSATDYNEAKKRSAYMEKLAEIQKKQFNIIRQHQQLIRTQIAEMNKDRNLKVQLLEEKKQEKLTIEKDKKKQEEIYNKFRKEETKLMVQLKEDERRKETLKQQISAAIRKEIAAEEERRHKEVANKKTAIKKELEISPEVTEATKKPAEVSEKKEVVYTETRESVVLSRNFEGNKGKLPWPVEKGAVTEGYGRNAHPSLDNVVTQNNGIDITTTKGATVRAVFEGEVSSIITIPGAGKVVIIKHGNYRTVYSNLLETYVKLGSKISTKQALGTLLIKEGESIVHFEVHHISGMAVQCLNPSLWVSR